MQKISFGDKEYVKASVIAKRFKYTQDYVGQLCRGKKVDARLVGRTWYVVADSVTNYRKTKHKTQKAASVATQQAQNRATKKKIKVSPVIRGKTAKILRVSDTTKNIATARTKTVSAKYSKDTTAHIPVVAPKTSPRSSSTEVELRPHIHIKKAVTPKRIKVVPHSKKKTVLGTEKMPEITLSAKLNVSDGFEQMVANNAAKSSQQIIAASKSVEIAHEEIVLPEQENGQQKRQLAAHRADNPESDTKTAKTSKVKLIRDLLIVVVGIVSALAILAASSSIIVGAERVTSINFSVNQLVKILMSFVQ